jgi:hypothetical protein
MPLGLPRTAFFDAFPEPLWPWLAAAAPLVNIAVLHGLSRGFRRR